METILPTHPERSLRLFKRSFMLSGASFTRVFLLAFVLSIIVFSPRLLSIYTGHDWLREIHPVRLSGLWVWALNLLCLTLFIAMIWRIHCVDRGFHEPLAEDFRKGLKKILYDYKLFSIISLSNS